MNSELWIKFNYSAGEFPVLLALLNEQAVFDSLVKIKYVSCAVT